MTRQELAHIYDVYTNILGDLCMASDSFCDFLQKPSEYYWQDAMNDLDNGDYNIYFAAGATKAVIILDDYDWVIKIPFLWEREGIEYDKQKCTWAKFKWNESADYCKREWRNYAAAVDHKLAECFAQTYRLGDFEDCPLYIQEKLDCDEENVSSYAYDSAWAEYQSELNISDDNEDIDAIADEFSDAFYDRDGEGQMEELTYSAWDVSLASRFWDFCNEMDCNDLHCGNWSYDGETLVVVDFGGFGRDIDEDEEWSKYCYNVVSAQLIKKLTVIGNC